MSHAVLLAGGKGTRLRPYTTSLPKPLVPLGEQSIVEIVLRQLAARGFARATLAIGHLGHLIEAVVGDGSQWGISVDYVTEDEPLGTMGPVVANLDRFPDQFLVMNGDVLTDLDYAAVLEHHVRQAPALTIATYRRRVPIDFGVLETDEDRVVAFREKPTLDYTVSMGVYGISRSTLGRVRGGRAARVRRPRPASAGNGRAGRRVPLRWVLARHRTARGLRPGQRGLPAAAAGPSRIVR